MRKITVRGTGEAKTAPDLVMLELNLKTRSMVYESAMEKSAEKLNALEKALEEKGFTKGSLKTVNFEVETRYESRKKRNDEYERYFAGFEVIHELKLTFDLDTKRLSTAISAVAACLSEPDMSIRFTVKDPDALKAEVLRSAAVRARRQAEILCEASGCRLGDLVDIDYSWNEMRVYSKTRFLMDDCVGSAPGMEDIDITPDDIENSESVRFEWEIL